MNALSPIVPLMLNFYRQADWSIETAKYAADNFLDLETINAHAGMIAVLALAFSGNGTFDFGGDVRCAVIEVLGDDSETVLDLCAWPIDKPQTFATAIGAASVLGAVNIANPATWAFDHHLVVHRSPLDWLRADCQGVCILDYRVAPYDLSPSLGPIQAQDPRHAAELRRHLCKPPLDPGQIIYPRHETGRAA